MPKDEAAAAETVAETTETGDPGAGGPAEDQLQASEELPVGEELDPNDPAVTGIPRDERHDSIDPATGLLTEEAQALRTEQASAEAAG